MKPAKARPGDCGVPSLPACSAFGEMGVRGALGAVTTTVQLRSQKSHQGSDERQMLRAEEGSRGSTQTSKRLGTPHSHSYKNVLNKRQTQGKSNCKEMRLPGGETDRSK